MYKIENGKQKTNLIQKWMISKTALSQPLIWTHKMKLHNPMMRNRPFDEEMMRIGSNWGKNCKSCRWTG